MCVYQHNCTPRSSFSLAGEHKYTRLVCPTIRSGQILYVQFDDAEGRLLRSPSCVSHRRNTGQREKYDLLVFASFFRGHDSACALLSFAHVGVSSLTALHVSFMFTFQMFRRTGNLTALPPTHTYTCRCAPVLSSFPFFLFLCRGSSTNLIHRPCLPPHLQFRDHFEDMKYVPLDLRPKKTRAIRRRLTPEQV